MGNKENDICPSCETETKESNKWKTNPCPIYDQRICENCCRELCIEVDDFFDLQEEEGAYFEQAVEKTTKKRAEILQLCNQCCANILLKNMMNEEVIVKDMKRLNMTRGEVIEYYSNMVAMYESRSKRVFKEGKHRP